MLMKAVLDSELREQIYYVNIGRGVETLFNWRNPNASSTFNQIDVIGARNYPKNVAHYVHLKKPDYKIVFRKLKFTDGAQEPVIFIVSGGSECQYQVLEAFIEYLMGKWQEVYGDTIVGASYSGELFDGFDVAVDGAFDDVPQTHLSKVRAHCRICDKDYEIYVRKSLVDNAPSSPVALVFEHEDHALLLYIDKQFVVRGENVVEITG
ncbi:MAG TPA: hypothetical protein VKK79_14105 [Candidatus Lokiarchaeia archaeon]|nr:hypothetical protein [Candidatus Lokiarchaeia archaeon]